MAMLREGDGLTEINGDSISRNIHQSSENPHVGWSLVLAKALGGWGGGGKITGFLLLFAMKIIYAYVCIVRMFG